MKNDKYTVFIIQAHEGKDPLTGYLKETVTLELIADNEKEAMKRAKALVKKAEYRLATIIEKYGTTN